MRLMNQGERHISWEKTLSDALFCFPSHLCGRKEPEALGYEERDMQVYVQDNDVPQQQDIDLGGPPNNIPDEHLELGDPQSDRDMLKASN
jgi:hypothetical protein